ncbi:MAG: hypothetical protein U0350_28245 [Caldilineaceae bacterium]
MDLATLQQFLRNDQAQTAYPFRSPAEILVTLTEELGEVIKEVSLFERIGTKAGWDKAPSHADLTEEMLHLLNLIFVLANHYQIDLAQAYTDYINRVLTE